jgi:hypothetical protein
MAETLYLGAQGRADGLARAHAREVAKIRKERFLSMLRIIKANDVCGWWLIDVMAHRIALLKASAELSEIIDASFQIRAALELNPDHLIKCLDCGYIGLYDVQNDGCPTTCGSHDVEWLICEFCRESGCYSTLKKIDGNWVCSLCGDVNYLEDGTMVFSDPEGN